MTSHNMPRTPFSTPLSGSARETELRLKNIFSGPKKRPPVLFLALMFSLCVFCGNLVSCQVKEAEVPDAGGSNSQPDSSQAEPAPIPRIGDGQSDLNQNGIWEEIRLVNTQYSHGNSWEVQFWEGDELIDREAPGVCLYSYSLGGPNHILRYSLDEYQGNYHYYYSVSDFSGEFEDTFLWNQTTFDTNFNSPFHKDFDPEEIAGFMDELNGLLSHSLRLSNADGELAVEDCWPEDLSWLDSDPERFVRDPDKSLLENLRAFQAAMPPDWTPPAPELGAKLPFDQPIKLEFYSGAGSWRTELTLNPDGSFTGDYCDADMDIQYVCQFHGRFGDLAQVTDSSWYMTLEELVLDTKYPVGTEWDEPPYHYISSEPYGFDGEDGTALKPGAGFILYTPEATGHQPGTELYGAYEFWTWQHTGSRNHLHIASQTLNCWGLYNLETGYGVFSDT